MSAVPAAGHFRLRRGPEQWPLYFLNRRHRVHSSGQFSEWRLGVHAQRSKWTRLFLLASATAASRRMLAHVADE